MGKTILTTVLPTAPKLWKTDTDELFYVYLYMAPDPKNRAEHRIGHTITSALSNHILVAYHDVKVTPITKCNCEDKFDDITESHITPDFGIQNLAVNVSCHDASCLCSLLYSSPEDEGQTDQI